MTDFEKLLRTLSDGGVLCIIVGGFAGTLHGSSIPTRDLDVVYEKVFEVDPLRCPAPALSRAPTLRRWAEIVAATWQGAPPSLKVGPLRRSRGGARWPRCVPDGARHVRSGRDVAARGRNGGSCLRMSGPERGNAGPQNGTGRPAEPLSDSGGLVG